MTEITLSIVELRQWCARTLDVVETAGHSEVSVPRGLYYFMDPADIWRLPPAEPVVGDSLDDVSTLREELVRPIDELVDWHSLQHLIGVLTVVASQITPQLRAAQ